jgi:ABC-type uncharacterized transport system permease subunit
MNLEPHGLIAGISIALYCIATTGLLRATTSALWPRVIACVALVLHAIAVHNALIQDGALYFSLGATVSLFAWQCALLCWLLALARPLQHLGIVIYMLAALSIGLGYLSYETPEKAFSGSWGLGIHVLLSLLSYGLLTIAALQALALLAQDRGLRQHHSPPWTNRLPALETMEQMLFQLMGLGLFLLSLTLLSGLLFVDDLFAQHLAHKTFLSLFAWLVFSTLLWGRWQFGWRGRKAINWTLGGYISLLLAYFGSKWVLEVILN